LVFYPGGSGDHAVAGSGSTVEGSVSGSHVIQENTELGKVSDTLTPGIRGDAGDHEAGLGGISATGGLGIGGNAEPGAGSATGLHGGDSSGAGSHGISGNTELGGSGVAGSHELGGSSVKNAGSAGAHRVSGSRGHEGSTKTGVQIFGTNTGCNSGRTAGDVGEPGDDERRGHGSASENGAHGLGDSVTDKFGGLARNVSGHRNVITGTDGFVLGGAHGGSGDAPEQFQTTDAGVLDGSTHGFGIVDSATEETVTFSGSSSEVNSGISSASGVDSVNSSDSDIHAGSGSQPGVSGSGSSFFLSHNSSGSEVKGGKKLPVGVKG
jgi:hypothetical protein